MPKGIFSSDAISCLQFDFGLLFYLISLSPHIPCIPVEPEFSLLGMEQALFCGTVMLEQGKTGRFMELKPGEQVNHVINLLGLKIYNLYYEKAKELANQRKSKARDVEDELKLLSDASAEK